MIIRDLEVAERPFLWLQSAGEVQKLLSACNENICTLVAVLVGRGMRLDEALHLMRGSPPPSGSASRSSAKSVCA